jgi:hypothetical protein
MRQGLRGPDTVVVSGRSDLYNRQYRPEEKQKLDTPDMQAPRPECSSNAGGSSTASAGPIAHIVIDIRPSLAGFR